MIKSSYYNFGALPKTNMDFSRNRSRLNEIGNKFNVNLYATDKNYKNNIKNVNSNQSSINLNSSKRFANTYNFTGRNSDRNLSYEHSLDGVRQLLGNRLSFNGNANIQRETEKAPKVQVKRVVDIKGEDFTRLYNSATKGPLSDHVIESGVYKGKRYIVLDNVRYENKIPNSERLKTQKFQWMR